MDPTVEEEISPPEVDETDQKAESVVSAEATTTEYEWHKNAIWF